MSKLSIDDMANFCKRKGFVYPSSELYGGIAGLWDFGPLGVELKKNLVSQWWKFMVHSRSNIVGMDGAILSPEIVWRASGHLENFDDLMLVSQDGSFEVRADQFLEEKLGKSFDGISAAEVNVLVRKHKLTAPNKSSFRDCSSFNLMFPVSVGAKSQKAYLRGETTQMIYLDYKLIQRDMRLKLPFGIAQVGKAFRNEISPRNFLFRCREFEQLEMQFFIDPSDAKKWFSFWQRERLNFFVSLGISSDRLRFRAHAKGELAHYARQAEDVEYKFPFGWKEIEGVHNRGDWDLSTHAKHSKQKLEYFDDDSKKSFIPYIIETSAGLDRMFLAVLFEAYTTNDKGHVVLKLSPRIAPIKAAVLPLVKKDAALTKLAGEVFTDLVSEFNVFYDESGSIGRRYARSDEVGTPFCVTIDADSVKNGDVTIRSRDDGSQKRIKIVSLRDTLRKLVSEELSFSKV